ncbi:hypothetical protein YC2023_058728 [Brassica napus]
MFASLTGLHVRVHVGKSCIQEPPRNCVRLERTDDGVALLLPSSSLTMATSSSRGDVRQISVTYPWTKLLSCRFD